MIDNSKTGAKPPSTGLRDRAAELLPCPFCGGQPETFVEQTKAPVLYVWCGNDKCRVQPKVEDTDNELARNAWNTRALAPAGAEGWRPIETAPKDGTVIDVWRANAEIPGRSADVSFREPTDSEYWAHGSDEPDPKERTIGNCPNWMDGLGWPLTGDEAPTHWMQKPAPPNASPAPSPAAPPAEARDLVERYARAICTARGHGPETLHQVVDPTDYADTSDSHGHRFIYGWRKWVAAAEAVAALPARAKTAEDR